VVVLLAVWAAPGFSGTSSCTSALATPTVVAGPLKAIGSQPVSAPLPVIAGHSYLIQVTEHGNDLLLEVLDPRGQVLARADHPERRTGTQRAVVAARESSSLLVRVRGAEHAGVSATATVQVFDLATFPASADCLSGLKDLAEADAAYAAGVEISRGHSTSAQGSRAAFLRAAQGYSAAERSFGDARDAGLEGQAALALAGVEYFGLQDWAKAADSAETAATILGSVDLYRQARAEALLAGAWIEIGSTSAAGHAAPGHETSPGELLERARQLLRRLEQFHLKRGERYDAALQLTNIGLTYLNEGSYPECVRTSAEASRRFDSLHEIERRAQAWQNQALCLWGLGRLPEALRWFRRALDDISPESYPGVYMASITNTALAAYALGDLDESLRLYDQALPFAQKVQSPRDEAYCLYGIGVNYYALGDRQRARQFLERSLAIRTVALDGRGRMASLRALATIDAEQGRLEQALAADREALALAIAPSAIARIKIQQATHTAAAGHPADAKALLDEVIAPGAKAGPLIQAEALLQRAVLLRSSGQPREALADLAIARPRLHAFGNVMEEFEGDLELARALRLVGQPQAALAAVEQALAQSDAVRMQTANPELRAQLQSPLRPAYDLKLDLLRDQYEQATAAGRPADANLLAAAGFATADAARARSFADVAAQRYSPAVRQELANDFSRREELYRELSARRFALDSRLERSGEDDPRAQHLVADIAELRRQADTINTRIASRAIKEESPSRSGREPVDIPALPSDTVLVSYWLGATSGYAWVVAPSQIHWIRLPSPGAIATRAVAFHRSLTRLVDLPAERRLQEASALYNLVVRPLEPWLSGVRNWVIVPDGALAYVPFAALQAQGGQPRSFVVSKHDIAVTPAAWMLEKKHAQTLPPADRKILLVADPIYQATDPRRGSPTRSPAQSPRSASVPDDYPREYQRLPFTAVEAAGISAQFAPGEVEKLIGVDATRDRLLALDWSRYRYIHIATHGIVDAQVPQLSALILGSYDGKGEVEDHAVRVADVSVRTLSADVAVLSACETALGPEIRSEGLVGMSSTMLARGARAVVASLWPVPDEIGARLMTEFYQHMLHDSMRPEAALGSAMRSAASHERSADPALWAAFQVSVATLAAAPTSQVATVDVRHGSLARGLPNTSH
jgi:CHAT domain-containing protein/tetratricopeptide (TPR) repeat protein